MPPFWLSARALGASAALASALSQGLPAQTPPASGDADKPKKLTIDLRITPAVSFAPSKIRAIAELKLPEERTAEFYCAAIEWDWGDLTESAESNECEPYEGRGQQGQACLQRGAHLPERRTLSRPAPPAAGTARCSPARARS
jgi:hypothetical protein